MIMTVPEDREGVEQMINIIDDTEEGGVSSQTMEFTMIQEIAALTRVEEGEEVSTQTTTLPASQERSALAEAKEGTEAPIPRTALTTAGPDIKAEKETGASTHKTSATTRTTKKPQDEVDIDQYATP